MTSRDKGVPLPKFGEWDVNNPASAEGFTVIFNKARDEKKTVKPSNMVLPGGDTKKNANDESSSTKKKWSSCAIL